MEALAWSSLFLTCLIVVLVAGCGGDVAVVVLCVSTEPKSGAVLLVLAFALSCLYAFYVYKH